MTTATESKRGGSLPKTAGPLVQNVDGKAAKHTALLLSLAARCEHGDPSRELEIAIFRVAGTISEGHVTAWCGQDGRTDLTRERYIAAWAPNYCKSLDAAVSLVPPDCWRETNGPRRSINIPSPVPNFWKTEVDLWRPSLSIHMGWAATEALSICAAALKARAAMVIKADAEVEADRQVPSASEGST